MPKNTKTPIGTRPGILMSARVQEDDDLRPVAMSLEGKTLPVVSIDEWAEEKGEFWEPEPVWKMRYRVTLEDGRQVVAFRNMKTGS